MRLLRDLVDRGLNASEELWSYARELDRYYTPTMHPNARAEGSPFEYYSIDDAGKAISSSEYVLRWVENIWKLLEEELKKGKES